MTPKVLTSKRSEKLEAILSEGARIINSEGAGSIRIAGIAKTVGLSRNALYNYIKDRSDLVKQCYLQSCDTIDANLRIVLEAPTSPTEQVAEFIKAMLLPDTPYRAAVVEIDILDEFEREPIRGRQKGHIEALSAILRDGQELGVFRQFNVKIAAHAVFGMLDWVVLWMHWISDTDSPTQDKRSQYCTALIDSLFNGFMTNREFSFVCPIDYNSISLQTMNVFDRTDANLLRRQQLTQAASTLFNRMGLDGVSVDTIAEHVGVTKGAIYHHFKDKTNLIDECYRKAYETYERIWDIAQGFDVSPAEKLLIDFHVNCQAQASDASPLILQPGMMRLPDQYLERSRSLANNIIATVKAGQDTRLIRKGRKLLVEISPGAFFWIQKWQGFYFKGLSSIELADELTYIFGGGILIDAV